jgi:pimeloyl-ACP methyl ester carboxylesterase
MKKAILLILLVSGSLLYAQEKFVRLNNQNFRIRVLGKGDITVIFESGMSDSLEVWGSIPDSVAKFARVFTYDRADIGKSDTSKTVRTIPNVVFELRSILENQQLNPPYVLVGHSLGGLLMRYFAGNYPTEVRGMLLLDPAPESYWNRMSAQELDEYIKGGTAWYETNFPKQYRKEWYQFIPNLAYMNKLNINKNLPLILVSATAWKWYAYQEDILAGFVNSRQVELEGEHHIYKNHPDAIIAYIKELVFGAAQTP